MKTASKETGKGTGNGTQKGKSRALENFWGACRVLRAAIKAYTLTAERAEKACPEALGPILVQLASREAVMVAAQDHVDEAQYEAQSELRCALVASGMEAA